MSTLIVAVSHILRPADWATLFRQLHELRRTGAFINGMITLIPGAMIVAGHWVWSFPGIVVTLYGLLLVVKSAVCLLFPDVALRSMRRGGDSPRGFIGAGVVLLCLSVWTCYSLWKTWG
ncbi:MAG: hypothetical protein NT069_17575 [Planctomycetota bacterium]|nr:hypothetical protein [Planctomycetota bacterium]